MIKAILVTEKALRLMEKENVLTLIVDKADSKSKIKRELEKMFNIKIANIRSLNEKRGKKMYVRIKEGSAKDIASKYGVL